MSDIIFRIIYALLSYFLAVVTRLPFSIIFFVFGTFWMVAAIIRLIDRIRNG